MSKQLTPKQVENWRKVMVTMFGPVALILPVEKIQAFRDMMQEKVGHFPTKE